MATIDPCKLLCASASAYLIQTSYPSGMYQLDLINPKGLPKPTPLPLITKDVANQYNKIGLVDDPYVIVSDEIEACFVGKTKSEIILSFRGTLPPAWTVDSILDWIQNIFLAVPGQYDYFPGKVHSGFHFALTTLICDIVKVLNILNSDQSLPLYITGHSKGGAMAPLAAVLLSSKKYNIKVTQTITFAGPKPGNATFRDYYNSTFTNDYNYENYLDIVPFLPPGKLTIELLRSFVPESWMTLRQLLKDAEDWNYEPVGNALYVTKDSTIEKPTIINDTERLAAIAEALLFNPGEIGKAHHVSCNYRYMKAICKGTVCGC
ncbi:lipase family protein [Psychroserpens algicola]|uniref:lipase family protein n=1 Tax=Psychroserpens algicola TaxID=1719034 RepID=UPI00195464B0|nr:lipase family protein [Psychroserpens algicola]